MTFEELLDFDITPATAKQIAPEKLAALFAAPAGTTCSEPKKKVRRARHKKTRHSNPPFITPRMQEMMDQAIEATPMIVGASLDKAQKSRCNMRKSSGRLGRKRRTFRDYR